MTRKSRTDSVGSHSQVVAKSFVNIKPPKHIRMAKEDMPFFENVVSEFARSEWSEHALEIASILARTLCDLEREQFLLREEGSISTTEKGTPVANPRKTIVQMHAGTILSLRKSLGVDARAKGDGRDLAKQQKKTKSQETDIQDDLIARPTVQ